MRRIAVLGALALGLGACDFGLGLTPDPADPGETVTVTNAPDGPVCEVPNQVRDAAPEAEGDGVPVDIVLVSNLVQFEEEPPIVATVETDADGFFTATFPAPDLPGEHIVFAFCDGVFGGDVEPTSFETAAEQVDEDGVIVDTLRVGQDPLSIALSDSSVEEGDEVVATFNRCQDENELGFLTFEVPDGGAGGVAEPTTEELATDFPDLEVFLDGELVGTVAGEERNPTGTVDVPVTLDEVGTHEIKGVCTYQTFDVDLELLAEMIGGGEGPPILLESSSASAAAIEYPVVEGEPPILTLDEATTEAAAPVTVTAADVGAGTASPPAPPAQPAPVAPTFTG